jgi:hypothetical protein
MLSAMRAQGLPARPADSAGDTPGLQARLAQLSAPQDFTRWAAPYGDLASCWAACPHPGWLLWAAARLASTVQQRREVVCCAEAAARAARLADPGALHAISAAGAWAQGGQDAAAALAAVQPALDAAAEAAALAAQQEARPRQLIAYAPRGGSAPASWALDARLASHAARRRQSAALTAAVTTAGRHRGLASPGMACWRRPGA